MSTKASKIKIAQISPPGNNFKDVQKEITNLEHQISHLKLLTNDNYSESLTLIVILFIMLKYY